MRDAPKWHDKLEHKVEGQRKTVAHVVRRDTEDFEGKRNLMGMSNC